MSTTVNSEKQIGYIDEYPTMHYLGIPRHTHSMIAYKISGNFIEKLHCGNVVNMLYLSANVRGSPAKHITYLLPYLSSCNIYDELKLVPHNATFRFAAYNKPI